MYFTIDTFSKRIPFIVQNTIYRYTKIILLKFYNCSIEHITSPFAKKKIASPDERNR